MDEKNINISKSEEELLEIMENRSHITAGQLHNLEEDEECLQACSDLAEIVIEMQKEQNSVPKKRYRTWQPINKLYRL